MPTSRLKEEGPFVRPGEENKPFSSNKAARRTNGFPMNEDDMFALQTFRVDGWIP
jgi:hypothetical protein